MLAAIETTGSGCGVALFEGGHLRAELHLEIERGHDRLLAHLFDQMLRAAEVDRRELRQIAVSAGPGSFTGIRIGLSFAIGLSLATGAEIVPVPTLDAIAYGVRFLGRVSHRSRVIALVPAKGDELYAGLYEVQPEFRRLTETKSIPVSQVASLLDENVFAAGPGVVHLDRSCSDSIALDTERLTASAIGRAGLWLHFRGVGTPAEEVRPLYIADFTPVLRSRGGEAN